MDVLKKKLLSRKLWTAIVGIIMGVSMVFGLDQDVVSTVAGAVVSLISVITYIYTEGKIDAASVGRTAQDIQDAIDAVNLIIED